MIGSKVCLLLLCGLPGAGKSTLSKCMRIVFPEVCSDHQLDGKLECVEYDAVMRDEQKDQKWTPEMWRFVRSDLVPKRVQEAIAEGQNRNGVTIILLDDNFYFRSMRKMYFQMAQQHDIGFIQLFLDTDIETAQRRNQEREVRNRVPENIIQSMAQKFEKDGQALWEKHSIHVSMIGNTNEISKQIPWPQIFAMWSDPLPCNLTDEEEKIADRQMTAQNFIHRLDIALRREMNAIMTIVKSEPSSHPSPPDVARTLNASRKEILTGVKLASDIAEPDLLEIFYVQQFRNSVQT
eukprot:TRINITY_DN8704_c0_g1_i1.p1 TRINITY_DN8704_c0_g1~~TRINITY_DN8704_c0_g1_i1.p1  ORF type:complete len:293 (+),score=57.92 TRINITY_DN8704_c0_g1_i1:31-909(+)